MKVNVYPTAVDMGKAAAGRAAEILNAAIKDKGSARIILSTGSSQFETIAQLVNEDVDWSKVELFNLDDYVDMPTTHKASFRRYLKERFLKFVSVKAAHLVDPECDIKKNLTALGKVLNAAPIDVALIGVGINGHIAFNDPPADFTSQEPFLLVALDETCRRQQFADGCFETFEDVPRVAITMSPSQILKSDVILSAIPRSEKADAVLGMLTQEVSLMLPATLLKTHPDVTVFLDADSAAKTPQDVLDRYK